VVGPIAVPATRGAWYRQWRLVSLDGSTLDVADEAGNAAAFGRPGSSRGDSAYPQIRFVSLVENGTHVLFAREAWQSVGRRPCRVAASPDIIETPRRRSLPPPHISACFQATQRP
jgi:hypothetical protein